MDNTNHLLDTINRNLKNPKILNNLDNNIKKYVNIFLDDEAKTKNKIKAYKTLGSLGFVVGNLKDLLRQRVMGFLDPQAEQKFIKPFQKRLENAGIDTTIYDIFVAELINLNNKLVNDKNSEDLVKKYFKNLQETKDEMLKEISMQVENEEINFAIYDFLHSNIYVVDNIYIPELVQLKKRAQDEKLTYHDMLIINNYIYDNFEITNLPEFTQHIENLKEKRFFYFLDKAADYYNAQKLGLIYYESLVTLLEIISMFKTPEQVKFENLLKENDGFGIYEKHLKENKDNNNDNKKSKNKKQIFDYDEYKITDKDTIHTYLYKTLFNVAVGSFDRTKLDENNKNLIEDLGELIYHGFEIVQRSEHKQELTNVLQNAMRSKFEPKDKAIWTRHKKLYNTVVAKIEELNKEFEEKAVLYMENIPEEILKTLIEKLRAVLSEMLIPVSLDANTRGILIEQIKTFDKVKTYKHLNQFSEIIEKCKFQQKNIDVYNDYYLFVTSEDNKILERLALSLQLHDLQEKQSFFVLFEKYLKIVNNGKV